MKKICILALVLVLTVSVMAGCRSGNSGDTTNTTAAPTTASTAAPTTMPTTAPTTSPATMPTTVMTEPTMEDILPGTEDTVDPTNGANNSTGARTRTEY